MLKNGLPSKIIVRDEKTRLALKDTCEKLKIKLEVKSELIAIDNFYAEFIENNSEM